MGFKNFEGIFVGCLKITEDKTLDADLTKCEDHSQLKCESQVRRENRSQPIRGCHHTEKCEGCVQRLDLILTLLIKREPEKPCTLH